jgi:hypothetical protein
MRYILLLLLVALAVVLLLHFGTGKKAAQVEESTAALDKAKLAVLPMQLQQVEAAVDAYADENGDYPQDLEMLVPRFLPQADLLIDPWGTRLRLEKGEPPKLFLVCAGPDRAFGTGDDSRRSL